jgi:glycerophosphoryl diester phosphodiesterase
MSDVPRYSTPLVIAHRGASGNFPENTLRSIEGAIRIGAKAIEIDVRTTRDGKIVLMHDADVSRTTDGEGRVSDLHLEEIRQLDAGRWFGAKFADERVPLLGEVLEAVEGKAKLCIEVKDALPARVLGEVIAHDMLNDIIVFDFDHPRLYGVKPEFEAARTLALGVTLESIDGVDVDLVDVVGSAFTRTDKQLVDRAHDLGLGIFVYTVNDEDQMERLIEIGVDAIITNFPGDALDLLKGNPHLE